MLAEATMQPVEDDDNQSEIFDVEAYAANYVGHTKIARLQFIARKCGSPALRAEALRLAIDEILQGENTQVYKEVMEVAGDSLGPQYAMDNEWVAATDKRAAQRQEKLELELNGYKTNLIKESIRMGYTDLADFLYARGDLPGSFKSYVRTRDYCTSPKHVLSMCLSVVRVGIELGHFVHVANYVQKGEQTPDLTDPLIQARLKCAAGLAHLEAKKYKLAGRKFVDAHFELGNSYSDVISAQDIAVYGGLCALATFDRAELKSKILDNPNFRHYLELVPEVRELINDFYASRYASCLASLSSLRPSLSLDLHLHDHVAALYSAIRAKALIQYTTPFITVHLPTMSKAFGANVEEMEGELAQLIMEGKIQARIDSQNKVLCARHSDQRQVTFQRALEAGEDYERETRALLLRANLISAEIGTKASHIKQLG